MVEKDCKDDRDPVDEDPSYRGVPDEPRFVNTELTPS